MLKNWTHAAAEVLNIEGQTNSDPLDPGNKGGMITKYGITRTTLQRYWNHLAASSPVNNGKVKTVTVADLAALTITEAHAIYKLFYWDELQCDHLLSGLDLMVFDASVNHGQRQAALWLQRLVHAKQDGIVGPKTLAQVKEWATDKRMRCNIILQYAEERAELYLEDMPREVEERFEKGWINRLLRITQLSTLWAHEL